MVYVNMEEFTEDLVLLICEKHVSYISSKFLMAYFSQMSTN